jgi:hypothetical protein
MLREEIRNIRSEERDLRSFGIIFGVVTGVLAGLLWWKGKDIYALFVFLSIMFFFFGIIIPHVLKPLQKVWMTLALLMGFIMTRIILMILFYFMFTAIGLIGKLFGKRFLDLDVSASRDTYWRYRKKEAFDKVKYEKQF